MFYLNIHFIINILSTRKLEVFIMICGETHMIEFKRKHIMNIIFNNVGSPT